MSKQFYDLVELHGLIRAMKIKGLSRRQATKIYLQERDGVERPRKPRKPKPVR